MIRKLLVIGYVWPEPNSSAAGTRMLELVQFFLAQEYRVTFASAAAVSPHRFNLAAIGVTEKTIALNCSSFDDFVKAHQPSVVLFDRFFTEEQFGWRVALACPAALRILDTEDLHCLRHARQQLLKMEQKKYATEKEKQSVGPVLASAETLYRHLYDQDVALREVAAIFRCDLSLMISEFESEFLQRYFSIPAQLLLYLPFLHFCEQPSQDQLSGFSARAHFMAIGNFRHEPNWDSVLWLKHQLWPLIRTRLPHTELHIYGAYPPPKATQLHQPKDGFLIKGWADNVAEVMQRARVCLAPLRFGAGIKGKLMDAMRAGTPSVTTSIGAESMHGKLPWGGAIANDAQDFVAAAVNLYDQPLSWDKAQADGFTVLREYFSRINHAEIFAQRLGALIENKEQERGDNFIGQMLRHHHLKSTQYMGQWIEAKNRKE